MDFMFSMFEPRKERRPKVSEPVVEVRTNGRIVFNREAAELLRGTGFCMLGYDAVKRTMGIMPVPEKQLNAFSVRYASKGAYIGAKKFFQHFDILPGQALRQPPLLTGEYIGIPLQ